MGTKDQGIKRLLQVSPAELAQFLLAGCEYLGMLDTDVAVEAQRILDRLYHVVYQGEECGIDIEVQSSGDSDILPRMFNYAKRASFVYDMKIMSVVLWLRSGGTFTHAVYEERIGDRLLGTWTVYGIEIFRLQARDIIKGGITALLPLVPFMQGADVATIEEAAQQVDREVTGDLGTTLKTLLAVFTAEFHGQAVAKAILEKLKMDTSIVENSPLYQEWVQQAKASGILEGKEQGIAEGKEQGIAVGLREGVQSALSGRFGPPDADLLAAIARANEAALLAVLQHITTDTLDEISQRLS